jgi:hypothetical protein
MVASDRGQLLGGDLDVVALILGGHHFTAALQGVTTQGDYYTHDASPSIGF